MENMTCNLSLSKVRILLLSLLLCAGASALKRIIYRIGEPKNWFAAQAYCRWHHTDLLTIRNQDENDEITEDGWIGLHYTKIHILTWKWKWSSGLDYNVNMWAPDYQYLLFKHCGFKRAGVKGLYSDYCTSTRPFYCVDEFFLVEEEKTWEQALEYCRHLTQHHPTVNNHSYELASPLPLDDLYTQDVFHGGFDVVWIGLRYLGDQWWWLNGQTYELLRMCPQVHRCGVLKNTTVIAKRNCNTELFFMCKQIA